MPLPDGRIRSREIGTGEVNSRIIDNLRSSNYDGSEINPQVNAGTTGWQILKSGFVVFNEAIIRGALHAAEIVAAVIRGGQLDVTQGGKINVAAGGSIQVGDKVVLDETGLQVNGGFVTPVWPASEGGNVNNAFLTTTQKDFVTVTFDPPNWVETLVLLSVARLKLGNVSGVEYNAQVGLTNDDGGAHENRVWSEQTVPDDTTQSIVMSNREEIALSPAGRQVDVVVDASLSSSSNSSNNVSLSIIGFGIRNP